MSANVKQMKIGNFRGVDISSSPLNVHQSRCTKGKNWISDYGTLRKRNGWRQIIASLSGRINGIFPYKNANTANTELLVFAGQNAYRVYKNEGAWTRSDVTRASGAYAPAYSSSSSVLTNLSDERLQAAYSGSKIYVSGQNGGYYCYDYSVLNGSTSQPTLYELSKSETISNAMGAQGLVRIPVTTTGIKPDGSRATLDAVNLMTPYRTNKLIGEDYLGARYVLDAPANFTVPLSGEEPANIVVKASNYTDNGPGSWDYGVSYGVTFETPEEYFEESNGVLIGYTGTDSTVIIPKTVDGNQIYYIGEEAFCNNTNVKTVVVPNGVTRIIEGAFHGCKNLERVFLPSTIDQIGARAFAVNRTSTNAGIPVYVYLEKNTAEWSDNEHIRGDNWSKGYDGENTPIIDIIITKTFVNSSGTGISSPMTGNSFNLGEEFYYKYQTWNGENITNQTDLFKPESILIPNGVSTISGNDSYTQRNSGNTIIIVIPETVTSINANGISPVSSSVGILYTGKYDTWSAMNRFHEAGSAHTEETVLDYGRDYSYLPSKQQIFIKKYCNPIIPGEANISVTFKPNGATASPGLIANSGICTTFGIGGQSDRMFVTGNSAYPNRVWFSEEDDFSYFPDNYYADIGSSSTAISGFLRLSDSTLAIFKNDATGVEPSVYYMSGRRDIDYSDDSSVKKITPVFSFTAGESSETAVNGFVSGNVAGDSLIASRHGVYAIALSENYATNSRTARERSRTIGKCLSGIDMSGAAAIVYRGKYYLSVGGTENEVFVADTSQKWQPGDSEWWQYEWYRWTNVPARVWAVCDDVLMFGTSEGRLCAFDNPNWYRDSKRNELSLGTLTTVTDAISNTGSEFQYADNETINGYIQNGYRIELTSTNNEPSGTFYICNKNEEDRLFQICSEEPSVYPRDDNDPTNDNVISVTGIHNITGTVWNEPAVEAEWETPIFDMGTNTHRKTLLRLTVSADSVTNGKMQFGYITRKNGFAKFTRDVSVYGIQDFGFDTLDFSLFSVDNSFASSYTVRARERGFNYIQFKFECNSPTDCRVNDITATYRVIAENKGVR